MGSLVTSVLLAILIIVGLAVAFGHVRRVLETRIEADLREREARATIEHAEAMALQAAWDAYVAEQRQVWENRLKTGYVLDIEADGRLALTGKSLKQLDIMAHRHTMRKDVYKWCQSMLDGKVEMIPFFHDQERQARIWFAEPNDALAFKLRWY